MDREEYNKLFDEQQRITSRMSEYSIQNAVVSGLDRAIAELEAYTKDTWKVWVMNNASFDIPKELIVNELRNQRKEQAAKLAAI